MFVFFASFGSSASERYLKPEVTSLVNMSNTSSNRVHCRSGNIQDVVYSEEKPVAIKIVGSNVFIKYLIKVVNGKNQHVNEETEFHIVCGDEIYTLIDRPGNKRPKTIWLGSDVKKGMTNNIARFKGMPKEELIVKLTLDVLRDEEKGSYQNVKYKEEEKKYRDVDYKIVKKVSVDGIGVTATEYIVTPRRNLPNANEKYFINAEFGLSIEGITLLPQPLMKGRSSRLIIVSGNNKG